MAKESALTVICTFPRLKGRRFQTRMPRVLKWNISIQGEETGKLVSYAGYPTSKKSSETGALLLMIKFA